jgi:predicted Zn-dependent peptidase
MEREREVILQEIAQTNDTPDDLVFENLQTICWPEQSIGRPILGTINSVKAIQKADLQQFIDNNYIGKNIIISAAGRLKHNDLVTLTEKYFAKIAHKKTTSIPQAEYTGKTFVETKDLEQAHVVVAHEGVCYTDDDYYAANIWSAMLGGGMASRLFQEIREKRGLAYSIFSYNSSYDDTGMFCIYAGTSEEHVPELMKIVQEECTKSINTLTKEELKRAKAQYTANMRMAQESSDSRMGRIPLCHFTDGRFKPLEESLEDIEAVTLADCTRVAKRILATPRSISALGAVKQEMFS